MRITPLPIAVLISGGGRTLRNFLARIDAGMLDVKIRLVVSSNPAAAGLDHARRAGIATQVVDPKACEGGDAFRDSIFEACRSADVQYVAMAGFIRHVLIPEDFRHRVINIHPALVPAFSGHGFYGHHVHQAVLDHGSRVTGCTVHLVDDQYDHGPIIAQRCVPVFEGDTAETLAARVFQSECDLYPQVLQWIAEKKTTSDSVFGKQGRHGFNPPLPSPRTCP
ncbi:MAG: phosphoribosylglycinamide formyltransferase [Pirellulales bacterium]